MNEVTFKNIRNVQTICLPVENNQMIDFIKKTSGKAPVMIISGWGRTETSDQISDVLLEARVPYINPEECDRKLLEIKSRHKSMTFNIQDTHMVKRTMKNVKIHRSYKPQF